MGLENMMQQHQFERHLGSDNREPASCLMCHHHRSSSSRVSEDAVWSFFSSEMKDGEMNGHPDKATLHQSAIEPRGSTVVSASRCLLVEVCPKGKNNNKHPLCRNRWSLPCFGSASSQTSPSFISFLCTACFRVVFVCRQVVFSSVRFFP